MNKLGIYIHIPFCDHKCIYCDFYSITKDNLIEDYISALLAEIEHYAEEYRHENYVPTIFFGGGTPSLISPDLISKVIEKIKFSFNVTDDCEITLETNPGTVDLNKLRSFRESGINRISIGVQSFNNDELKFLTRIHDENLAKKTVKDAYKAGFDNINLDLIFNLPGQTYSIWKNNLLEAMKLPITHISAYSLILEGGTVLNALVKKKKVKLNSEEDDSKFYIDTINFLKENGFNQYEVSNFSKPDYECKHNKIYWDHEHYLGFGTSAHSFYGKKRWWNIRNIRAYLESIDKKGFARLNEEILSNKELLEEYVMLKLRSNGINLNELKSKYKFDLMKQNGNIINNYIEKGFIEFNNDIIKLTAVGYNFCDRILEEIDI